MEANVVPFEKSVIGLISDKNPNRVSSSKLVTIKASIITKGNYAKTIWPN